MYRTLRLGASRQTVAACARPLARQSCQISTLELSSPHLRRPSFARIHVHTRQHPIRFRRFGGQASQGPSSAEPPLSLSQKLKKLSREYGWSALGVYLLLSALDFPFCFLAVRTLGTERIGHWEHVVVEWFWKLMPWPFSRGGDAPQTDEHGHVIKSQGGILDGIDDGLSLEEAERRNAAPDASIWTQLALAYAIHKSFIFIRVPVTAAVTPKVVRLLRSWGWDIGKRKPKAPRP